MCVTPSAMSSSERRECSSSLSSVEMRRATRRTRSGTRRRKKSAAVASVQNTPSATWTRVEMCARHCSPPHLVVGG